VGFLRRRRPKIAKLKKAGNVEGLQEALSYSDRTSASDGSVLDLGAPTRIAAAKALAEIDEPPARDALLTGLHDPSPEVRLAVVEAIGGLDTPIDPAPLVDRLAAWRTPEDQEVAARALDLLADAKLERMAERLVARLLDPETPPLRDGDRDAVNRLLAVDPRGPGAAPALSDSVLALLEEGDQNIGEERAREVLVWLGPAAADGLIKAFEAGRREPVLVEVAGILGDARLLEPLIEILEDDDPLLRALSATALAGLTDTRAVPALLRATQDPEQPVRYAASEALNSGGIAAVIVGVASVVQEALATQIEAGERAEKPALEAGGASEPIAAAVENQLAHPPTWAQDVLGRLRSRRSR
jgi:HEAT repeat protein